MCCRSPKIIYKENAQKHASLISTDISSAKWNRDLLTICKFSLENELKNWQRQVFNLNILWFVLYDAEYSKSGKKFFMY